MEGQKTENLLNLALDATQEEREKSLELEVGYHPEEREWDLIIKYSGDLEGVRGIAARTTELLNEYAVVTVAESRIQELAALPEVEYVEKPKRLYFQMEEGKRVSCINEVQDARFSLLGQGVLVGVIDSGIDYSLPEFRRADGTTRIKVSGISLLTRREKSLPGDTDTGGNTGRKGSMRPCRRDQRRRDSRSCPPWTAPDTGRRWRGSLRGSPRRVNFW